MPKMKPLETTYDPDAVDSSMAMFCKLPRSIPVALSGPVAEFGTATVDGIALTRCQQTRDALGKWKLMVPVGEVAREYGRSYTVRLEGFRGRLGRKFPACTFEIKTAARKLPDPAYATHDAQALQAAREGMVLLKNENRALPLKKGSVLNCFGDGQHMYRISATGASKINPRWAPTFLQAVADHSDFTVNTALSAFYRVGNAVPDDAMLRQAKALSDTAILFITRHSGEGQDNRPIKGQYYLTDEEYALARFLAANFEKTVLILNTGYPIDLRWTEEMNISAILYTGFAGMLSAYALTEILDGRTNPSGCLPDTWAWDYRDYSTSDNQPVLDGDAPTPRDKDFGVRIYYEEDIFVGYRYFDTFQKPVAYPFGYGLSYTQFEIKPRLCPTDGGIAVEVTVTNTGTVPGKKAVQLYVSPPAGRLQKAAHVLAGFEKTELLQSGESQTLVLTADPKAMASYDEENACWRLEQGRYTLAVGDLAHLQEAGQFALEQDNILSATSRCGTPVEDFVRMTRENPQVDGAKTRIVPLRRRIRVRAGRQPYRPKALPPYRGKTVTWERLQNDPSLLDAFVAQMSLSELAMLNVCAGGQWGEGENGCCGHTYALKKYGLPSFFVSDANAGVNIFKPNIGFPASSVIAATFNKDIAYQVGRIIALESLENGIFLNLGPGMNLHRQILCGRHPEYFSEDPFLAGTMAGHHGKGLEENGVACCYKHLFCNGSDLSRMGSHSIVSTQALRELYFRVFERAFEIHKPSAVMTGYNALNGLYPAENAGLLQELVRREWGFDGFIMSDWNSYHTVNAVKMVNAGNCWLTLGGMFWVWVVRLAAYTGLIRRSVLENNVRWLIKTLLKWNTTQNKG